MVASWLVSCGSSLRRACGLVRVACSAGSATSSRPTPPTPTRGTIAAGLLGNARHLFERGRPGALIHRVAKRFSRKPDYGGSVNELGSRTTVSPMILETIYKISVLPADDKPDPYDTEHDDNATQHRSRHSPSDARADRPADKRAGGNQPSGLPADVVVRDDRVCGCCHNVNT